MFKIIPDKHFTALHWAAIKGHMDCYNLLIACGAGLDIKDASGKTATDYFVKPTVEKTDFNYSAMFR